MKSRVFLETKKHRMGQKPHTVLQKSRKGVAKEDHRCNSNGKTDPLPQGEPLPKDQQRREGGEDQAATVDNGKENGTLHHARKVEIELVICRNRDTAKQHRAKKKQGLLFCLLC